REAADQTRARPQRRLRVQTHELVVAVADRLRRPTERGDGARRLRLRPLERLAALVSDALRELVDALRDPAGDVIERIRPDVHREVLALLEGLGRGGDGLLDVRLGRN